MERFVVHDFVAGGMLGYYFAAVDKNGWEHFAFHGDAVAVEVYLFQMRPG